MLETTWPAFAFSENDAWGRCYHAFLRSAFERSGSERTRVRYEQTLTHFFTREPRKLPDRYSREDIENFIHSPGTAKGRVGKPVSAGSVNNRLSVLASFFAYSAQYTIVAPDGTVKPLLQSVPPTLGMHHIRAEHRHRTISYADFVKLMDSVPTDTITGLRARAVILFLFWSARRRAEVCNIRWGDISHSTIIENGIERPVIMYGFYGKGFSRQIDFAELSPHAYQALVDYLTASGRLAHMRADSPLFTSIQHMEVERALTPKSIWLIVKTYARPLGLDISVHSLRHMAIQQRAIAGESIFSLQKLLRHRSLSTTSIYLQSLMGTADPAAQLLEDKFGKF